MRYTVNGGVMTCFLSGRVDSANCDSVEREIEKARAESGAEKLILDAEELRYISSAGLRMILRMLKSRQLLKVTNAGPEVYEIFEMTGFTEMMTVEKAYRRISVEGCEVIGRGAAGIVYRLDPDTIVKVYLNADSLPEIRRERELARKAFVRGIPTAIPYDVVRVGDGYGSVFELLSARSLAQMLAEDPGCLPMCIERAVGMLKKIHAIELPRGEMPDMREIMLENADFLAPHLPKEQYEKLRALIAAIPEDHHMLHCDFHVKNVMVQNGETLLIDMDTLCLGNPVFEFASVFLAHAGFGEADHDNMMRFFGIPYELSIAFWRGVLRAYLGAPDDAACDDAADRARVLGYARMMHYLMSRGGECTAEERALIENCKKQLAVLLPRVDSLRF